MTLLTLLLTALSLCAVGMVAAKGEPPAPPPEPPPEDAGGDDDPPKSLEDALKRWPGLRKDMQPYIKAAMAERFKNQPPPQPVIPPEVKAKLDEYDALLEAKQKLEDAAKSDLQKQIEANERIKAEEAKKTAAEKKRADDAVAALRGHRLDAEIIGFLTAKNKGYGVKFIPRLVREEFQEVDGKFIAKDPETGAPVGVSEYMESFLRQPDAATFLPPPLPGSGTTGGGRAGSPKPHEYATPQEAMAAAIRQRMNGAPSAVPAHEPVPTPEPPPQGAGS